MKWDKSILKFVPYYNLILVDTNFFEVITDDVDSDLCERLYDTKRLIELEPYEERLKILHDDLVWKFMGLVMKDNVFTVPDVLEELKRFRDNLNETYKWQDRDFKKAIKDKKKFRIGSHFSHRSLIKKDDKFLDEILEEDEVNEINYYKKPEALVFLNCVINDLYKIIKNLKVYDKFITDFSISVHGASETDYKLVGAALDYHEKNKQSKISIISNDEHIWRIRNKNSLETYFDVINLSNYKNFLRREYK